jgi:hypothetical protein
MNFFAFNGNHVCCMIGNHFHQSNRPDYVYCTLFFSWYLLYMNRKMFKTWNLFTYNFNIITFWFPFHLFKHYSYMFSLTPPPSHRYVSKCMCVYVCIYLFSCPSVPAPQLLIFHCECLVWCIVVVKDVYKKYVLVVVYQT